jgi:transcriptional regulator with XRE-family HTH domain
MKPLARTGHLLGAKLRAVRKHNGMTLDDLSSRCVQLDPATAPSVSYLSMIEGGKRQPSADVVALLARVFQREVSWFHDDHTDYDTPPARPRSGARRVPLEPSFLFSKELLQAALPELLSQTGTSGRQFAQLLIRAYQERSQNDFPDLERAAEKIGERRLSLQPGDLLRIAKHVGLRVTWFERKPGMVRDEDRQVRSILRSFFEPPNNVYLNRALQDDPARLKFDLATHIGHLVLHGGDGMRSAHATGGEMGASPEGHTGSGAAMSPQDVLRAWRDFECSFFAGALLCPKVPFRRFLARERYRVDAGLKLELTPAVIMRRMTNISPYPHWHFFDAYTPGFLRAVYRGNGIPLPWGNMTQVTDPCPHWAVFRMLHDHRSRTGSQISVLPDGERVRIYCCHSVRTQDMAGNAHVLSVGVDLAPAVQSNGGDAEAVTYGIFDACLKNHGAARISKSITETLQKAARVLNIAWIEDALELPARIICPRSTRCPRGEHCSGGQVRARAITDLRREVLGGRIPLHEAD